ncbi:MAG: acetylxylan esterase [Kiritimatiellae bacterium]|nr:acetylxylan esterase [Kiritimatiellia bacterium]
MNGTTTPNAANSYPHMVLDYYVEKLRAMRAERAQRLKRVRTRADALRYRADVRRKVRRSFGPMPKKTPLRARTTGTLAQAGYRIEKVLFESRPGFLVSANLYVPDKLDAPAPGVVGCCGHSEQGKAADAYQGFAQALVHSGFVVLVYDPIDQGERDQYLGLPKSRHPRGCCHAHNMVGKQMEAAGEFFGMWRAWDGIRAHDYLRARKEVDPTRIGVTGNSGGGTLSTYLWALDPRFAVAAPSCFVTTYYRNLTNEEPADCEQCPPDILRFGCEQADLLIGAAPKPLLLLGQEYDFFDRRGLEEAYADVSRISTLLGARRDDIRLFVGPTTHGYSPHNRAAMVRFFCRQLGRCVRKRAVTALAPDALFAARRGQVARSGSRRTSQLVAEKAVALKHARRPVPPARLPARLADVLQVPRRLGVPDYRILKPQHHLPAQGDVVARFAVETEPGILAILKKVARKPHTRIDPDRRVALWLPHVDAYADMCADRLARSLHATGDVYYLDVRGLGESLPVCRKGQFFHPYDWDYMLHSHGLMFGESYLGRRVFDVLRTMDLLRAEGVRQINLYGRGMGAVTALFAACLHPCVRHVTLKNGFDSYLTLATVPVSPWPASVFPAHILETLDLPDCRQYLGRRCRVVEPWNANPPRKEFPGS